MKVDGFDWDDGNWPKCSKHGLTKQEVEAALQADPLILPDRNSLGDEVRFNAVGRNTVGRAVFIVFTLREKAGLTLMRPISARYMHAKEIRNYERQTGA